MRRKVSTNEGTQTKIYTFKSGWPEERISAGEQIVRINVRARAGQIILIHYNYKPYIAKLVKYTEEGICVCGKDGELITIRHGEYKVVGVIKRPSKPRIRLTTAKKVEEELNRLEPIFSIQNGILAYRQRNGAR